MKILSIDTSLAVGSVTAAEADRQSGRTLPVVGEHARRLAAAVADAARDLGWTPADVDLVAVVRGPGSFTGLRVGIATAKAIAWAAGARLVAVSGFDLIARRSAAIPPAGSSEAGKPIWIAYDAGRGEVFAAVARPDPDQPGGWRTDPAALLAAADWIARLPAGSHVSGPALTGLAERLEARGDLRIAVADGWLPTAADAAALAALHAAAGRHDDPHELVPDYLRPSYADETACRPSA
jgi:tRNA threonylcarbamoyladenosine biosynthesis protein TsaB